MGSAPPLPLVQLLVLLSAAHGKRLSGDFPEPGPAEPPGTGTPGRLAPARLPACGSAGSAGSAHQPRVELF